jgi:hypothetical protein
MRLGLLGPAKRDTLLLRERAAFLVDTLKVERAVYLGVDGALDEVVGQWARELVGGDPSDDAVWKRAAQQCGAAGSEAIGEFLRAERRRQQLKVLECLPHASSRTIELFGTVVAVLIHDKAQLNEEDILPASVLVFGRASEPVVHRIGTRCFVSPGPITHPAGGVVLLADDAQGQVSASLYGADGTCVKTEVVAQQSRGARMTVQGGA